jgi:hypothetical protein
MAKLKTIVVTAAVLAGLATATVEVRATLALRRQIQEQGTLREQMASARADADSLNATLRRIAAQNPNAAELARLHARVQQLRARPDGVLDSEIHRARNLGRATPAAAIESYAWAFNQRDLAAIAAFITFSDDSPEHRETFLAQFSDAIRRRYGAPERIVAAGLLAQMPALASDPTGSDNGFQVFEVSPNWRPGSMDVRVWRRVNGREFEDNDRYIQTANGWAPAGFTLAKMAGLMRTRLDPATGEMIRPPSKPAAAVGTP